MVFVDNRAENAAGAEAIGAVGHHYTSPAGLRAFLQELATGATAEKEPA
jgi:putative hydrolase of the HAD superfamily